MGYIVQNELPKSCSRCSYCYLIMQNPLSSKTPIKRYRCQVGKAPWRTFDVDFYDEEYKDKDCPLVPVQEILDRLEELEQPCYDCRDSCNEKCLIERAIEIVKEVGGMNEN